MRKIIAFLLLAAATQGLFGDWKTRINDFFKRINDYEGAIQYLTGVYEKGENDKKTISMMLAFLYHKIKSSENEKLWIGHFFDPYVDKEIQFDFLSDITNIEISDYMNKWKTKYPVIKAIKLSAPEVSAFNVRPRFIDVIVEMGNKANYQITEGPRTIRSGMFRTGINRIRIIDTDPASDPGNHYFLLELRIGSVQVTKNLILTIKIGTPPGVRLVNGQLKFSDKDFRDEHPLQEFSDKEKYFDKHYFFSKSLPLIGAGLGLYMGDELILMDRIDSNNFTRQQAPLLHGTHHAVQVISVGLVIKGTVNFIKSFKTRTHHRKKRVYSPSAAAYNEVLKKALIDAENDVKVIMTLEIKK